LSNPASDMSHLSEKDELKYLRVENARLKALLARHGISWEKTVGAQTASTAEEPSEISSDLSTAAKIRIFRKLFKGRSDVFPRRWESARGRAGYSPACANEWKRGICQKPKVKCSNCEHRELLPVTDQVVYDHLAGKHTIGVYPLLTDDTCFFLAVDFDKTDWRENALAFLSSCNELKIPAALEISRSGNGAHVWIFFSEPVSAREARQLGTVLISYTCERTRQLSLESYDRLFPNQDTLPKGGFGNLIALPLQKHPRSLGRSVFVDESLEPYPDQWDYLYRIQSLTRKGLEDVLLKTGHGTTPLDVAFVEDEESSRPWTRSSSVAPRKITAPLPESLRLVLADMIYIEKADLPQPLANRLIRLAAFKNPEFYKAQAMRLPVWNKPRVICCAENFPRHIGLPRGCLDALVGLLNENGIKPDFVDERLKGCDFHIKFTGLLRKDQSALLDEIVEHETGVYCAPTGFGKTVIGAALIAKRGISTLVLVHRTELLLQWQNCLREFLEIPDIHLGIIGSGKKQPTGKIDIAMMQSLSRFEDVAGFLENYGQIIVDECHHISAFSFETILKQAKPVFVAGFTATPVRRDGHHPIIFMQCGPLRHTVTVSETMPSHLEVRPRFFPAPVIPPDSSIQEVFRILINDERRNRRIVQDVKTAYEEGRKVLLLTERTGHLHLLRELLDEDIEHCYMLHGRMSKKQRRAVFSGLEALSSSTPRILIATGRLIGEGFDYPPLDTLVLAMPISWKGTLQQYAGRLHREYTGKQDVRIYDYVDQDNVRLSRMWKKRQRGYRSMGYVIKS